MSQIAVHSLEQYDPALRTFFVHVPKCGGTSAYTFLSYMYPPARALRAIGRGYIEGSISVDDLREIDYDKLVQGWDFVTGHIPFADIMKIGGARVSTDFALVTVVRNPLQRFRSAYSFARKNPHYSNGFDIYQRVSFSEYLSLLIDDRGSLSYMAEFMTGRSEREAALSVLQNDYVAVAPLEDLGEFLSTYHARVGGSRGEPDATINATGEIAFDLRISDELHADFVAACEVDMAIYDWSKANWREHMEQKISERLPDLQGEIAARQA